jgi:hypothetical protein
LKIKGSATNRCEEFRTGLYCRGAAYLNIGCSLIFTHIFSVSVCDYYLNVSKLLNAIATTRKNS